MDDTVARGAMSASKMLLMVFKALAFLRSVRFHLPSRTPLDVTDFGLSEPDEVGLVAWVIVNTVSYCSKILVLAASQVCPNHFHRQKQESFEVVGGRMRLRLWGSAEGDDDFGKRSRTVRYLNAREELVAVEVGEKGLIIDLYPGCPVITILPGTWHEFWAVGGMAAVREISGHNDDVGDNVFENKEIGRFTASITNDVEGIEVSIIDGFIVWRIARQVAFIRWINEVAVGRLAAHANAFLEYATLEAKQQDAA